MEEEIEALSKRYYKILDNFNKLDAEAEELLTTPKAVPLRTEVI